MTELSKPEPDNERMGAAVPLSDHVARFWRYLETEHVHILVDMRRIVGEDKDIIYWDGASFPDDVAKALVAERNVHAQQTLSRDEIKGSYLNGRADAIEDCAKIADAMADEQQATNEKYPEHARAYDTWRHAVNIYREVAQKIRATGPLPPQQELSYFARADLRRLVDIVWNEATESTAVPSTDWSDRMIDRAAIGALPPHERVDLPRPSAMQTALRYMELAAARHEKDRHTVSGAGEGAEIYHDAAKCIRFAMDMYSQEVTTERTHQDLRALWLALDGGPKPRCRDCADEPGICPRDKLPCDPQERALKQIAYLRSQVERKDDFRWLIEAPGPRYLAVQRLALSANFEWTADHNKALAFRSEAQADDMLSALRQMDRLHDSYENNGKLSWGKLFAFEPTIGNAKAVEHGWLPAVTSETKS